MMMATMSIIKSSISFVQMTKNCGGGSALFGPLCTGQQCSGGATSAALTGALLQGLVWGIEPHPRPSSYP
jgi:hypothetical protein